MLHTQRTSPLFIPSTIGHTANAHWVLVGLAGVLAGCAPWPSTPLGVRAPLGQPPVTVQLAPAYPLPARAGSVYVYDRNTVKRLLAVEKTHLVWQTGDDTHWGALDFFAPPVQTKEGQITSSLEGAPSALWPLEAGRSVAFRETRLSPTWWSNTPRTQVLDWRCEVLPATVVYTPAGDYPSWPVQCDARPPGWPLATERITWDYAPALGQPVRVVWFEGGRQRGSLLWGALPGIAASPQAVERLLQRLAVSTDNANPGQASPSQKPGPAP